MVSGDAEKATTVDGYLARADPAQADALRWLRGLCLAELPGFVESVRWGMPVYERDGVAEVAFAGQRRHLSLYVMRADVMTRFADRLASYDVGKGCLRFRPNALDLDAPMDPTPPRTGSRSAPPRGTTPSALDDAPTGQDPTPPGHGSRSASRRGTAPSALAGLMRDLLRATAESRGEVC